MEAILSVFGTIVLVAATILETVFAQARWLIGLLLLGIVVAVVWTIWLSKK